MSRRRKEQTVTSNGTEEHFSDLPTNNGVLHSIYCSLEEFIFSGLWKPIPCSSLVTYRILWGLIMFYECYTYTLNDYAKIEYLLQLRVRFHYWGFDWVKMWAPWGLYLHIQLSAVLALGIAAGFYYRLCSILFFLLFSYLFLQEMTLYLNHFYLIIIISFMFIFLPLNQCYSVDAYLDSRRNKRLGRQDKDRHHFPYWALWIVQALIVVVYTFAGVAKLNEDWLRGEPLLHWLPRRRSIPLLGYFLVQPWVAILFSYAGLILDLFMGPLMWLQQTRQLGFVAVFCFHIMNKIIFNIGVFPFVMLASTTIFFDADWVVQTYHALVKGEWKSILLAPSLPKPKRSQYARTLTKQQILILLFLFSFLLFQVLVPLRHFTYPRNVNWTEEGHRWSWRMKLRDKIGVAKFYITDTDTNKTMQVDQDKLLTLKQQNKVSCRPELIHLFAHEVAKRYQHLHNKWPKITVESICSLNFRPWQYMVLPTFDLASIPPWTWPNNWVVDLVPLGVTNSSYFVAQPAGYFEAD